MIRLFDPIPYTLELSPSLDAGNDLARVLNWGGNLGAALQGTGLVQLLHAVYQSTPALLDRWDVSVQPTVGVGLGYRV